MIRSTNILLRKLITIPSLSPSHSSARIISRLVPSKTHVTEYEPVLVLQCSPDLIEDPAMRKSDNHQPRMLLESLEEGEVRWKEDLSEEKWYDVGMIIGEIVEDEDNDDGTDDDDDEDVEEWTWQAYLDEDNSD